MKLLILVCKNSNLSIIHKFFSKLEEGIVSLGAGDYILKLFSKEIILGSFYSFLIFEKNFLLI